MLIPHASTAFSSGERAPCEEERRIDLSRKGLLSRSDFFRDVVTASIALLIVGFVYSLYASYLAYRESGETWMLFFPTWIDVNCGISNKVRWHGKIAFAILFISMCGFII